MKKIKTFTILTLFAHYSAILAGQSAGFEKHREPKASYTVRSETDKAESMYNSLMDQYDVKFYWLNLEADNSSIELKGSVTIKASVVADVLDSFVVELNSDYMVDSVWLNGAANTYSVTDDEIFIHLDLPMPFATVFESTIFYHGSITNGSSGFFSGISHSNIPEITYTLSEPLYATDWFPCKQVLTDKADSVYIFVTTDESLKVGSNGLLTNTVNLGNGKVRYEWKSRYPIAYYLISMTIGNYLEYSIYAHPEGLDDSILIQNYLYDDGTIDYYREEIDMTATILEAYCNMFGMYPFSNEKYGHCMAPIGGGMEHQTMTTLSSFSFELVAHELAHMWFGDYITCGTWQDIWINEGFATYSHLLALEYLNGTFPVYEMSSYIGDQTAFINDGSIFIPAETFNIDYSNDYEVDGLSNRIFDWYLSYQKGAVILHMLRYELNDDDMFFTILRSYLSQYQYNTATGVNFRQVVEDISGTDFTSFFNQWYFGEGFPRYRISWFQENDTVVIRSRQGKSFPGAPFFRMNMDYQLNTSGSDITHRLEQTQPDQVFIIPFPETVLSLEVDPDHWVLADIESITNEPVNDLPVAINSGDLNVYPNPVTDRVTVSYHGDGILQAVSIIDTFGKSCLNQAAGKETLEIVTDFLSSGIYFMIIQTTDGILTMKITKE